MCISAHFVPTSLCNLRLDTLRPSSASTSCVSKMRPLLERVVSLMRITCGCVWKIRSRGGGGHILWHRRQGKHRDDVSCVNDAPGLIHNALVVLREGSVAKARAAGRHHLDVRKGPRGFGPYAAQGCQCASQ